MAVASSPLQRRRRASLGTVGAGMEQTKSPLTVIGNPSSAASYAAGQDRAPRALRDAGLIPALIAAGRKVVDTGDLPQQIWRPDRVNPRAQNVSAVVENLSLLRMRLTPVLRDGGDVLVLGGNCTGALACVAAMRDATERPPALLYIDRHLDCNTPESTTDGALDWMGMAHGFDLPGTVDAVCRALGHRPLLDPDGVTFLGVDLALATEWERRQVQERSLFVVSSEELSRRPGEATADALARLPAGPLIVHVDVDVLDFVDAPLAENTDGRNSGPTLDDLRITLDQVKRCGGARVLSIGELNPTRSAGDPDAIPRFVATLAAALAAG